VAFLNRVAAGVTIRRARRLASEAEARSLAGMLADKIFLST
jgi:hypothetical protein